MLYGQPFANQLLSVTHKRNYVLYRGLLLWTHHHLFERKETWLGTPHKHWYVCFLQDLGDYLMPPKRNTFKQIEFVNYRATKEEKAQFEKDLKATGDKVTDWIEHALLDELKFSVSFDAENDCSIVTLTSKSDIAEHAGKALVVRASDWYRGILFACWINKTIPQWVAGSRNDDII